MKEAVRAAKDLVIANRILAHEGLVDAFGDVSVRHPVNKERFFLACGKSPGAVVPDDVVEFALDGTSRLQAAKSADSPANASFTPQSMRCVRTSRLYCMPAPRTSCRSASPRLR